MRSEEADITKGSSSSKYMNFSIPKEYSLLARVFVFIVKNKIKGKSRK